MIKLQRNRKKNTYLYCLNTYLHGKKNISYLQLKIMTAFGKKNPKDLKVVHLLTEKKIMQVPDLCLAV